MLKSDTLQGTPPSITFCNLHRRAYPYAWPKAKGSIRLVALGTPDDTHSDEKRKNKEGNLPGFGFRLEA